MEVCAWVVCKPVGTGMSPWVTQGWLAVLGFYQNQCSEGSFVKNMMSPEEWRSTTRSFGVPQQTARSWDKYGCTSLKSGNKRGDLRVHSGSKLSNLLTDLMHHFCSDCEFALKYLCFSFFLVICFVLQSRAVNRFGVRIHLLLSEW